MLVQEMKGGEKTVHPAQAYDLAILNTFYSKRREHQLTYKSGGNATVIDYIMVRRENLREFKNCKVIPEESIATQHMMLVMDNNNNIGRNGSFFNVAGYLIEERRR